MTRLLLYKCFLISKGPSVRFQLIDSKNIYFSALLNINVPVKKLSKSFAMHMYIIWVFVIIRYLSPSSGKETNKVIWGGFDLRGFTRFSGPFFRHNFDQQNFLWLSLFAQWSSKPTEFFCTSFAKDPFKAKNFWKAISFERKTT